VDIDRVTSDKMQKMLLYWGAGSRSALAPWMLKKIGLKHVIFVGNRVPGLVAELIAEKRCPRLRVASVFESKANLREP
jgi:hypothetical protein